jgi:endonuclease/exonuclease/phosphatase family metal-dependent hydrolase
MATQLAHPDLERDARARGRPLEDERDATTLERAREPPIGLQLDRAIDQVEQLVARKLLAGEEVTRHQRSLVRALTWNLFHGRDWPPDRGLLTWRSRILRTTEGSAPYAQVNRELLDEFAGVLAALPWDIAFLQEVPPRWLRPLARATGAGGASVLTSRNWLAFARTALARWNPDLIASNEGGSNQLLVRPPWRIEEARRVTIARRPERRRMLMARLATGDAGTELVVANLHGPTQAAPDAVLAAADTAVAFAGPLPLIFGGDLNQRPRDEPAAFERLRSLHGLAPATAPDSVDHLLARGLGVVEAPHPLPPDSREVREADGRAIRLSDHPAVAGEFEVG